jgi:hypothetical protein
VGPTDPVVPFGPVNPYTPVKIILAFTLSKNTLSPTNVTLSVIN